jgi:tetratricopeptide (TPR) repeat protein
LRLNNNPITEMQSLDTNTNLKTLSLDGIKLRDIKNLNYLLMHLNIDKSGIERRIILEESPKQQESSKIAYPFDMGMNLIKFGDFEAAIDIYFNLIRSSGAPDVKIANAYAYLGDIYIALAKFTRALRCYQKASNIGLNLYKRVKIASIFFAQASQGRFKKPDFSQQHIDQVKIESIGPVSWNEIGVHYQINGFYEEAYKSYRRALELNQKDESALRNLERLKEMF